MGTLQKCPNLITQQARSNVRAGVVVVVVVAVLYYTALESLGFGR